ncbi:MAG: hypothetical protein HWN81_00070 [Candidatus Lokiarchaeota archaeon]|nr:hypothetical protein [Candidatus Lokiarchaeota archaeon]
MLLSKINVLDHGYVGLLSANLNGRAIKNVSDIYFKTRLNKELLKIANATFIIKCPLFVQIFLSQFDLKITPLPSTKQLESYIPDVSEIDTGVAEDDRRIAEYIKETNDALELNSKGFEMDGCDRFTSQTLTPINKYNEVIMHGSLQAWMELIRRKKLPKQLEQYRMAIYELLKTEWLELDQYKEG